MYSVFYILLCLAVVGSCIKPLGCYMARVYEGKPVWLDRYVGGLERLIYRVCGIKALQEVGWRGYTLAMLALGMLGFLLLFAIFTLQKFLPLNPQGFAGLAPDLAFDAAVSFVTNSDWQSYSGESALSYFSQSVGCAVQNFLSAATGMVVAVALFRSLIRKQVKVLGNPYADMVRTILYILLPMSVVFALVLVSQGVIQNYAGYVSYMPLEGGNALQIPGGPVASQVAIKMLGSNGGGFFNANGAHPFENPTPFSNLLELVSILLIPAASVYTFGEMAGDRRQGWMMIAAMLIVFIPLLVLAVTSERHGNPYFDAHVIKSKLGNMEGKETRIGIASSVLWGVSTAATSNGSVNSMHDSFMPMTGLVCMLLLQLGDPIFGGVGSGMYSMLIFVMLTVFMGGLMVGRTPEYLGKKLAAFEIKMASLVALIPTMLILLGTAMAISLDAGKAGIHNPGAHGLSEVMYAFSSATNNNGSAFAGLDTNTPFYNISLGLVMFIGRYWLIVPVLAIAGSLVEKNTVPVSAGTLPTHTPLFTLMLVSMILMVGVLNFVPPLVLGPYVEHLHLMRAAGGL